MKNWNRFFLCLLLVLSLTAWGCGDSDDSSGSDTTGGTAAGGTAAGGAATGGAATGGAATGGAATGGGTTGGAATGGGATGGATGGAATGGATGGGMTGAQCSADDQTYLMDPANYSAAQGAATNCALMGCLNDPDPGTCAANCMVNDQGIMISSECAGCYAGIVLCTLNVCVGEQGITSCLTDPSAEDCAACQAAECTPAFFACIGFEPG